MILIDYEVDKPLKTLESLWEPAAQAIKDGGEVGAAWKRNEQEYNAIRQAFINLSGTISIAALSAVGVVKRAFPWLGAAAVFLGMLVINNAGTSNADRSGVLHLKSNVAVENIDGVQKAGVSVANKISEVNTKVRLLPESFVQGDKRPFLSPFQITNLSDIVNDNHKGTLTDFRLKEELDKGRVGIQRLENVFNAGVRGSVHYSAFDGFDLPEICNSIQKRIAKDQDDTVISSDLVDFIHGAVAKVLHNVGFFTLKVIFPLASESKELSIFRYNGNPIQAREGQLLIPRGLTEKYLAVGTTHYAVLTGVEFLRCKASMRNYITYVHTH